MAKCMQCGGNTKMKKMAKGGMPTKVLGPAKKPFAAGIPYFTGAGQTGPESMKKGGAVKKLAKAQSGAEVPVYVKPLKSAGSKVGVGIIGSGIAGMVTKAIADKIKAKKDAKKTKETPKAKFGASVNVQRGYPGKIRSAGDQGYTTIGNREPARNKFQKGGSNDNIGGPSDLNTPGTMIMRADKDARSKYFTPDNIRKKGIKLSDKEIEKKVKVATDSLYKKYMKDANLTPEKKTVVKKPTTKKMGPIATGAVKKMATGGSLKPVPAGKVGLAKLPTAVRNKMGFQKKGGSVKK
jgi:hypothetical protein